MDADAQDLIAKLSTGLAPTDREPFRRAAENELAAWETSRKPSKLVSKGQLSIN